MEASSQEDIETWGALLRLQFDTFLWVEQRGPTSLPATHAMAEDHGSVMGDDHCANCV